MEANYSLEPVPTHKRQGVLALTFVMLGLTFFSASMWAGAQLGTGLAWNDFWLAIGVGNFLLGLYTAALGYVGAKTGLTTHLLARYSFGARGSWLPSFLLGGTQVGWFGVGVAMLAIPFEKATGLPVQWGIALGGLLMTGTVYFGIAGLKVLSIIAVPAIAIFGGYSVYEAITSAGGLASLKAFIPTEPMSLSAAIAVVVGSFVSAGTLTADFVRFGKKPKEAIIIAMVAFFMGNSLMFIFGATGARVLGMNDISDVMMAQGLLIPGLLVLGLNIWTTNDNALYASGLGFSNITGLSSRTLGVVNGIVGTMLALWLYNHFVSWLLFLSAAIPPVGGVMLADYFLHKERYQTFDASQWKDVNVTALISVALGVLCAQLPGIVPVNAILGGALSYVVLSKSYEKVMVKAVA